MACPNGGGEKVSRKDVSTECMLLYRSLYYLQHMCEGYSSYYTIIVVVCKSVTMLAACYTYYVPHLYKVPLCHTCDVLKAPLEL